MDFDATLHTSTGLTGIIIKNCLKKLCDCIGQAQSDCHLGQLDVLHDVGGGGQQGLDVGGDPGGLGPGEVGQEVDDHGVEAGEAGLVVDQRHVHQLVHVLPRQTEQDGGDQRLEGDVDDHLVHEGGHDLAQDRPVSHVSSIQLVTGGHPGHDRIQGLNQEGAGFICW